MQHMNECRTWSVMTRAEGELQYSVTTSADVHVLPPLRAST